MAKKPEREEAYIEQLEKEVRTLKSINRQLSKRLKRLDKGYKKAQAREDDDDVRFDEIKEFDPASVCPTCHEGILIITDIGIKLLNKCNSCEYRKTTKKI